MPGPGGGGHAPQRKQVHTPAHLPCDCAAAHVQAVCVQTGSTRASSVCTSGQRACRPSPGRDRTYDIGNTPRPLGSGWCWEVQTPRYFFPSAHAPLNTLCMLCACKVAQVGTIWVPSARGRLQQKGLTLRAIVSLKCWPMKHLSPELSRLPGHMRACMHHGVGMHACVQCGAGVHACVQRVCMQEACAHVFVCVHTHAHLCGPVGLCGGLRRGQMGGEGQPLRASCCAASHPLTGTRQGNAPCGISCASPPSTPPT